MKPLKCPWCAEKLTTATDVTPGDDSRREPVKDDLGVCWSCALPLRYTGEDGVTTLSPTELATYPFEDQAQIVKMMLFAKKNMVERHSKHETKNQDSSVGNEVRFRHPENPASDQESTGWGAFS